MFPSLLSTVFAATVTLLALVEGQQINRCYSCATGSLNRRWAITQLRSSKNIVFDTTQQKKCSSLNEEDVYLVNCTSPCMDLVFEDPDATTQGDNGETLLYVRGCHSELTGVSNANVQSPDYQDGQFCEYDDSWNTFKCDGSMATIKANFRLCTGNKCNNHKGVDGTGICAHATVNDRQCFECEKVNGECRNKNRDPATRKAKRYCTKTHAKIDGTHTYYVTQSNSDINLFRIPNYCSTARQTTTPIGGLASAHAQVTQCVCSDQDRCNSAGILSFIFVLFAPMLSLII
ncbi:unnamed protein product, partial [Mesorhabditis spiculigera]